VKKKKKTEGSAKKKTKEGRFRSTATSRVGAERQSTITRRALRRIKKKTKIQEKVNGIQSRKVKTGKKKREPTDQSTNKAGELKLSNKKCMEGGKKNLGGDRKRGCHR